MLAARHDDDDDDDDDDDERGCDKEHFHGALQKLLDRYTKCIATGGDYFEGDYSFMCVLSIKVPIQKSLETYLIILIYRAGSFLKLIFREETTPPLYENIYGTITPDQREP